MRKSSRVYKTEKEPTVNVETIHKKYNTITDHGCAAEVDCLSSYIQICGNTIDVFMQDGSETHIRLTREEAKSLGAALLMIT